MKFKRIVVSGMASIAALLVVIPSANAQEVKQRLIRMGDLNFPGNAIHMGATKFVELVEAKSGGKIKIRYFPSSQLGNEMQQQSALRGGLQEMFIGSTTSLVGTVKDFGLLDLPFVFDSVELARSVVDGPFGKMLLDKLVDKGIVGLTYYEFGFRNVTNSKRPVAKLEDFNGLKLRVIANPVFIDVFSALGANPVPMSMSEVYTTLETKAVDGQENSASVIRAAKLYEVQKYLSLTNHCYNPNILQVGKKFWDTLSPAEKKIFQEAATESRDYQRKVSVAQTTEALDDMKAKGMQINDIPAAEIEKMRQKTTPVKEKVLKEYNQESVNLFLSEIERLKK